MSAATVDMDPGWVDQAHQALAELREREARRKRLSTTSWPTIRDLRDAQLELRALELLARGVDVEQVSVELDIPRIHVERLARIA